MPTPGLADTILALFPRSHRFSARHGHATRVLSHQHDDLTRMFEEASSIRWWPLDSHSSSAKAASKGPRISMVSDTWEKTSRLQGFEPYRRSCQSPLRRYLVGNIPTNEGLLLISSPSSSDRLMNVIRRWEIC